MFPQKGFNFHNPIFLCKDTLMEKDKLLLGKIPCQLYQFWLYLQFSSSGMGMKIMVFIWWTMDLSVKKPNRLRIRWVYETELTNTSKILWNPESEELLRCKFLELWESPPFRQCGRASWNTHCFGHAQQLHWNIIPDSREKKKGLYTKLLLTFFLKSYIFNFFFYYVTFILFRPFGKY